MLSFWILIPLIFAGGYLLGRWHNRRWRYDRVAAAQRRLQLKVLSLEIKSLRQKLVPHKAGERRPLNAGWCVSARRWFGGNAGYWPGCTYAGLG